MMEHNTGQPLTTDLQSSSWDMVFDPLLYDLSKRQCVLLIGPEILKAEGTPLREILRKKLELEHAKDISHYHVRDSFYHFNDRSSKSNVQRKVSQFYETARPDEWLFNGIAQMPFQLIISVNPDQLLYNSLRKFNRKPRFAFFNHIGSNGEDALEDWDFERGGPLVYNLCGCIMKDVSLVLDYDDLFNLLKTTMGTPGLPLKIRRALTDAKSFFFLGFDFDKWHTQLLLRLLNEDELHNHFAINTQLSETDNRAFLTRKYKIEFIGQGDDFFAELFRRWQAMPKEQEADDYAGQMNRHTVERLLAEGMTERALDVLLEIVTDEHRQYAIIAKNKFKNWEANKQAGTLFPSEQEVQYNKILSSISLILDNLE